ncbi:unnamed protein product [Clavelina lepadiformis]|uniref:G-protein coupled receptors family 1 profile domain-containing protein n=1 Tax=Clavelina lepadiformis TaxID=159417 RepID=A0ABP0G072_CLALP
MSFSESPTSKVISTTDMLSLANNTFKLMFGETEIAITASIIFPLLVFGVVGNIVTIIVIYRSPKLKSTFNYVIFSICFSDLISALLSPLFLYRRTWGFLYWNLSDALCKIFWGGDNFTSVATSLHILLFAFFRLTSIMYPHWFNRITIKHVKLALIVVWVVSFGAGFIPFSFIFGARLINRHASNPERTWASCIAYTERLGMLKMYSKVGYSIFFYLPMLLITVLSTRIVYIIYLRKIQRHEAMKKKHQKENSQEQKQQKKEKKAVLQLLLIVGSFALGYIPHTDWRQIQYSP